MTQRGTACQRHHQAQGQAPPSNTGTHGDSFGTAVQGSLHPLRDTGAGSTHPEKNAQRGRAYRARGEPLQGSARPTAATPIIVIVAAVAVVIIVAAVTATVAIVIIVAAISATVAVVITAVTAAVAVVIAAIHSAVDAAVTEPVGSRVWLTDKALGTVVLSATRHREQNRSE
jgi:hypothetical protein